MECDSKLEVSTEQFIAKVDYGNSAFGLQCWYCDMLPGNVNRERNTRSRAFYDITVISIVISASHHQHCDFSLRKKWKAALCTLFFAHFPLLFETDTPTSLNFFLFFCDSVLQLLVLVTWIPGDHRIPKHRERTTMLYAVYGSINCAVYS